MGEHVVCAGYILYIPALHTCSVCRCAQVCVQVCSAHVLALDRFGKTLQVEPLRLV
jgi:hypothetical protein